jgi:surface carbohydrate biosynthesis protein (TIGR04326 family)
LRKGDFRSKYWEGLHDYLEIEKIPVDWVWFYFGSKDLSFKESVKLKDECNRKSNNNQRYFLLEEFLSYGGLWKSFILFLKLRRKVHGLHHLRKTFVLPSSRINFFPIMENNWNHSLFGIGAIEKIIWAIMFDAMAQKLPASPWGLYTWENQTWERALISAWKRCRPDSEIFGYEHSSVRLMDLRLFSDPKTYEGKGIEEFPVPDMLGINSSKGLEWMLESGYPAHKTTRIEALRYFHLIGKYGCFRKPTVASGRKLLMVTGIIPKEARFQIQLLEQANKQMGLEKYDQIWIKPHPGLTLGPILKDLKPDFKFTVVTRPIIELMEQTDVVYCANSTGASLEAAWLGVPLIILAAMDSMNLNPLFGFPGQSFVKDYTGLLSALKNPRSIEMPEDYFFLDEDFKSWKKILEL